MGGRRCVHITGVKFPSFMTPLIITRRSANPTVLSRNMEQWVEERSYSNEEQIPLGCTT